MPIVKNFAWACKWCGMGFSYYDDAEEHEISCPESEEDEEDCYEEGDGG